MRRRVIGEIVKKYRNLALLTLAIASLGVLTPAVRDLLYAQFDGVRHEITSSLSRALGRPLSYERLAPSVFGTLEIFGLEIDGPRNETLRIDHARAAYSIPAIVAGDVQGVVQELIIEEAFLEIDFRRDREFIENVQEAVFGRGLFPEDLTLSLREVEIRLIRDEGTLGLTNIAGEVRLQDPDIFADLQTRVVAATGENREVEIESQTAVQLTTSRGFQHLDGEVTLGRLFGTHLVAEPLAFDVTKEREQWSVTKKQDAEPFDLRLDYGGDDIRLFLEADDFVPGAVIAPGPPLAEAQEWLDSRLTGTGELRFGGEGETEYALDMDIQVPPGPLPEPVALSLVASGTPREARVEELEVLSSSGGTARYTGRVGIADRLAAGDLTLRGFSYAELPPVTGSLSLAPRGRGQGLSAEAITIRGTTLYGVSGSFDLNSLLAEENASFTLAVGLNPDRRGMLRGSGTIGGPGLISFDGEVEEVSLDELAEALASFDGRFAEAAAAIPDGRYRLDTRLRMRLTDDGLFVRAPFLSLYDTEDFNTYLSLNLTYDQGTLFLEDILGGFAGYEGSGSFFANFASGGTTDMELDLDVEGIEYSLRGLYTPGDSFVFSGGYGLDGRVYQGRDGRILFSLRGRDIPVPLAEEEGDLTFRLDGLYSSAADWEVRLRRIELDGASLMASGSPGRVLIAGRADPSGVDLTSIEYNDSVSRLVGEGSARWESALPVDLTVNARLESTEGEELYELSGRYGEGELSADLEAVQIPFARLGVDNIRGGVDLEGSVSGSFSDPRATVSFRSNEAGIATEELTFSGEGAYREETLTLRQADIAYSTYQMRVEELLLESADERLTGLFSLENSAIGRESRLTGQLDLDYEVPPFREGALFDLLSVEGELSMEGFEPLESADTGRRSLAVRYRENTLTLSGWYRQGVEVRFNRESGSFAGFARAPLPVQANFEGSFRDGEVEATVSGIDLSVSDLYTRLPVSEEFLDAGSITGALRVVGPLRDPDLFGSLHLRGFEITADPVGDTIGPFDAGVIFEEKAIRLTRTAVPIGSGEAVVEATVLLNRLSLEGYRMDIAIDEERSVPVDGTVGPIVLEGFTAGDIRLSGDAVGARVEGRVIGQSVRLAVTSLNAEEATEGAGNISLDLDIVSGRGVQFVWPNTEIPVLRSNIATQQEVSITADSDAGTFSLEGEVSMQSGDVFYFDRSFYIREGQIIFDETEDSFDPRVSIRAELREATPEGPVRIYLVSNNERLSDFSPRFESSPPLSTAEIVGILGGNILAQDEEGSVDVSSALLSTSDILTQFGVMREFEDNVRSALDLDLFSVRTQIFQNIVASAIEEQSQIPEEESLAREEAFPSLGSYLNNTSVFLGRYLGDELFLEMLVQLQADPARDIQARREEDIQSLGGVLIDPEIRLEWQTPFFLLEWNFAPNNPEELFIRDNVFTFSWGFSY
ncbi:MAG: translocation/assembly module TamB domain-containing protein [Spirochaetaceae bacterium]